MNLKHWLDSLRVYADRRVASILFLGFSSGLPLLLVYSTLSAWLSEEDVSLTAIGFFSWASSAYAIKWLWSPVVDALPVPYLTRRLGRRRGWLLLSQLVIVGAIVGLGGCDPSEDLVSTAAWAVALAFASATQDIVIDAYRIEILPERQQGAGAANVVFGYRIGMLAAGAGALVLADRVGWQGAYLGMAALMSVGIITTLINPEPEGRDSIPEQQDEPTLVRLGHFLDRSVVQPFGEFLGRRGWLVILLFIGVYKYGDALLGVMANPFYLDIGFTKTQIGLVSKLYGLAMTLLGVFLGGVLVDRVGILKSLLIAGILQALSNLVFVAQAVVGDSLPMLAVTISVENLTGGLGTAAFVAYLSSLCNVAFTATQYALLSSFSSFGRTIFSAIGGWLADRMSWALFFLVTTVAAVPGLVLLIWMMRLFPPEAPVDRPSAAPLSP